MFFIELYLVFRNNKLMNLYIYFLVHYEFYNYNIFVHDGIEVVTVLMKIFPFFIYKI